MSSLMSRCSVKTVKKIKVPFVYLSKQVDELYDKQFSLNDNKGIENHCEFIVAFINAAGWSEEEYIRAMFGFDPIDQSN
jgi:hypothetical protein